MTAEMLHDAIGLLPADLLLETDRRRSRPVKAIPWKRLTAMAASVVLVLFCGLIFRSGLLSGADKAAAPEMMQQAAAPEAPAAAAPMEQAAAEPEEESGLTQEEASPESAAGEPENALCIDHSHSVAEDSEAQNETGAYCGLTSATVHIGGESHTVSGEDAIALTDILRRLDYSPDLLCRCMAQFTVDTETQAGYEISLTEYFVRLNGAQAPLTRSQTDTIQSIVNKLPILINE